MAGPLKTFTADLLTVKVFPGIRDMAEDAAREANRIFRETIQKKGSAAAVLATGNSQLEFLKALVKLDGVDWSRVTLFHLDEYLGISDNHSASFRKYMRERVQAVIKPRVFNFLEGDAMQPLDECDRYAKLLQAQPIDLCCLGIGENGHLAFNDPPVADFKDPRAVKIVKLDEACRAQQAGEGHFPNIDAVPQYALTMTIPAICAAKNMLCIVPEKRKAQAVRDTLKGPVSTTCPGSFLRQQAHCTLYLDSDAASLI
jgi:glucosamine-6-phosphate deaminase